MKNLTNRLLSFLTCLLLTVFSQAQTQNFSFANTTGANISFDSDPCQVRSDITVTTVDLNGNAFPHSIGPVGNASANLLWIPPSGSPNTMNAALVTITLDPAVNNPSLTITGVDFTESFEGFSTGWSDINGSSPALGINPANGAVIVMPNNYGNQYTCVLNWTGCQNSISFIYRRGVGRNITLSQLTYSACPGLPPPPTTELEMYMNTDANSADVHWEIRRAGCTTGPPVCFGDDYDNNSACQVISCFLEDGDYELTVFNDDGDDFNGQYVLRTVDGGRIVDNTDGFSGISARHGGDGAFSLPMGTTQCMNIRQDKFDVSTTLGIALKTLNGTGGSAQTMTWRVYDPDGAFSVDISETPTWPGSIVTGTELFNQVPSGLRNKILNVRAICEVGGGSVGFGPATTFMVPSPIAPVPPVVTTSRLMDTPNITADVYEHSCDVERTATGVVWAPYRDTYKFWRFVWTPLNGQLGSNTELYVTRNTSYAGTNRWMSLNNAAGTEIRLNDPNSGPLGEPPASPTYGNGLGEWMVRVQSRRQNDIFWCDLGECCRVTIVEGFQDPPDEKSIQLSDTQQPLVWPNPNSGGQLFMDLTWTASRMVRVEVLDVFGRLVQDEQLAPQPGTPNSIQVGNRMSTGTYMVRITDGNEVRTTRLVISQ